MGSHFLTLYEAPLDALAAIVGSNDLGALTRLGIGETDEARPYIERLIQGAYARDPETFEAEDGAELVRALAALCEKTATAQVTLELYEDEEATPELWKFIWSEWEPRDPFQLPLSPDGAPAVTYKDSKAAATWLHQFERVTKAGGYDRRYLAPDQMECLLLFLRNTVMRGSGVFGFIEY